MSSGYDRYLEQQYGWSGDFYKSLFMAIALADTDNTRRLAIAFPQEVDAYRLWTRRGVLAFSTMCSPNHELLPRLIKEYGLGNKPRPDFVTDEQLIFLDQLRDSGKTNMYGSAPYLVPVFDLDDATAVKVVAYWMSTYRKEADDNELVSD